MLRASCTRTSLRPLRRSTRPTSSSRPASHDEAVAGASHSCSAGTASHLTRTARALRDDLPQTQRMLARGLISPQHVSAIAAVVDKVGADHAQVAEPIPPRHCARAPNLPSCAARRHASMRSVDHAGAEKALHDAYERRGGSLSGRGRARTTSTDVLDVESAELLRAPSQPLMSRSGTGRSPQCAPDCARDALVDLRASGASTAGEPPRAGWERPHTSIVIDEQALRTGVGRLHPAMDRRYRSCRASARRWACDAQLTAVLAEGAPYRPTAGPSSPASPRSRIDRRWLAALADVGRSARLATSGQLEGSASARRSAASTPGARVRRPTATPTTCSTGRRRAYRRAQLVCAFATTIDPACRAVEPGT